MFHIDFNMKKWLWVVVLQKCKSVCYQTSAQLLSVYLQLMQHFYRQFPPIGVLPCVCAYTEWLKHKPSVPCGAGVSRNPAACDKCFSAGCVCRPQQTAGAHTNRHSSPYLCQSGPDAIYSSRYCRAQLIWKTSKELHFSSAYIQP